MLLRIVLLYYFIANQTSTSQIHDSLNKTTIMVSVNTKIDQNIKRLYEKISNKKNEIQSRINRQTEMMNKFKNQKLNKSTISIPNRCGFNHRFTSSNGFIDECYQFIKTKDNIYEELISEVSILKNYAERLMMNGAGNFTDKCNYMSDFIRCLNESIEEARNEISQITEKLGRLNFKLSIKEASLNLATQFCRKVDLSYYKLIENFNKQFIPKRDLNETSRWKKELVVYWL